MKFQNTTDAGPDSTQQPEPVHLPVTQAYHAGLLAQAQPWWPATPLRTPNDPFDVEGQPLQTEKPHDYKEPTRPVLSRASTTIPDLTVNRIQTGDDATYPEGGLQAWIVVFCSWCALLVCLGTMNIIGSFQAYLIKHQLASYEPGTIGWIFSVYAFFAFAGGIIAGPAFDKYGARWLIIPGSVGACLSMYLIGECTQYWHFMLVFGILSGLSTSLMFTPSIAVVGHYFMERRGFATGLAATGGAFGGVVFPLMLESLIPKVGFAWTTRILASIYVVLSIIACIGIKARLPPSKSASAKPDFRIFKDPAFALSVAGVYLLEWGMFVPITYISSYAIDHGFSEEFSYQILVVLNVGSVLGRVVPGFYADYIGRVNTMILTCIFAVTSLFGVWLPLGHTKAGLVVFALMFGFSSGSNISLTPVCIGQLCPTTSYGLYYSTCYTIVSIGCLTGIPIVGEILTSNGGNYWGLILFVGACYAGGLFCFTCVRIIKTDWRLRSVY
jgi:MFS family permease